MKQFTSMKQIEKGQKEKLKSLHSEIKTMETVDNKKNESKYGKINLNN